jgi:hypothetical protein
MRVFFVGWGDQNVMMWYDTDNEIMDYGMGCL